MTKHQGGLSIARFTDSRGPSGVIIELDDEVSGTRVLSARISLADFAEALTGKSNVPLVFDLWPQFVGWTREIKEEIVFVAQPDYSAGRVAIHAAQRKALARFEVDGWRARGMDIGNQHRRAHDLDRDGLSAYRVVFIRFVEPPKDEVQTEEESDD